MPIENGHSATALNAADSHIRPVAQWTARGLLAIAFCFGELGMAGWIFDQPPWRSFLASGSEMKPNAALCLMLLGLALAFREGKASAPLLRALSHFFAGWAGLIGALTLLEYGFDTNFGLDELLFRDGSIIGTSHPGRMSPPSALSFLLGALGILLLGYETRKGVRPAQWLGLAMTFVPGYILLSYAYGNMSVLAFGSRHSYMAVPTALALISLALAILLIAPERGAMRTLTGRTQASREFRWLLLACLLVPPALGGFVLTFLGGRQNPPEFNVGTTAILCSAILAALAWLNAARLNRAEGALQRTERELRDFVENASVGMHWVGADGIILWANRTEMQLLGYSREEYIGHHIAEFHADEPVIQDILRRLTQDATLDNYEARLRCKDGSIRDVLINSNVLRENGKFVHTRCFTRDNTERKKAGEAQARLAAIVSSCDDGILSKTLDGVVTTWNAGAERMFGYTAEEIIGNPSLHLTPPDLIEEEKGILEQVFAGQPVAQFETLRMTKDGRRLPVSLTLSPIKDAAGKVVGASKIVRDITARKQAEAELRERVRLTALRADISAALVSGESLSAVLQHCAEALVKHLDAAFARVWTLNESQNVLELQASAGLYTHLNGPHGRVKVGEFKIGRIAQSAQPLLTNDVQQDANISDPEWAQREGMVAFAGYPMLLEGRVLGVMALFARHALSETVLKELAPITEGIAQWIRRRRAEEDLRESHQRTTNIVESITDAFVTVDKEWRFTFLNQRAEEILRPLRKAQGDLPGKNLWEELPDTLGTVVEENYRRCMDGQVTVEFELFYPPLNAWLEVRGYPSKDGISVYLQDITRRKQSEKDLLASENRKSAILNGALDAIITMDHEGKIADFNPAAEQTFGYRREEAVGQPLAELIIPERLRQRHYEGLARYLATGQSRVLGQRIEMPALHAEGREFPAELSISRIADLEPPMFTATLRDITARKQAEEQIRQLNADLEQRVAQRTAALVESNAELESFSYTVSHDLRAPLRHVSGFIRLLAEGAEGKLDETTAQYLPRIADAASRMGQLIDALLDFSRLGRAGLRPTGVNLEELLGEIRAHLQPDLAGRVVEWKIGPLPVVRADPAMLRQVLANLLENALKFTRTQPAAVIEITCESGSAEDVIRVRDNGAGFDPRYADKLFGVFQRLHSHKEFEGTGIGLATSRRIIHRHGGRIWAESQPGQGASFYFSLPKNGETIATDS